jgi:hypothetical protein
MSEKFTVFHMCEDFDNPELQGEDWREQLREAIEAYNYENDTDYEVNKTIREYLVWKRNKYVDL